MYTGSPNPTEDEMDHRKSFIDDNASKITFIKDTILWLTIGMNKHIL